MRYIPAALREGEYNTVITADKTPAVAEHLIILIIEDHVVVAAVCPDTDVPGTAGGCREGTGFVIAVQIRAAIKGIQCRL